MQLDVIEMRVGCNHTVNSTRYPHNSRVVAHFPCDFKNLVQATGATSAAYPLSHAHQTTDHSKVAGDACTFSDTSGSISTTDAHAPESYRS